MTFVVLRFDISKLIKFPQSLNILDISWTLSVLKLERFKLFNL